jgi:membrane protein DedA with SNARE-associated domain
VILLAIVCLAAGALLARRFKIIVLVPSTLLLVLVAIGAGLPQTLGIWTIVSMTAVASVCMQTGYLIGMLIQNGLEALLASRTSSFSDRTSARDSVR